MSIHPNAIAARLEDLPNIGVRMAAELRKIGIGSPDELYVHSPLDVFFQLAPVMGKRHDPCVLYTLLAVRHFQRTGEAQPWWKFTREGKSLIGKES